MSRVPSKLQVTVPQAIADQFGFRPGDEIELLPGESALRVVLAVEKAPYGVEDRLRLFDQATQRQREREKGRGQTTPATDRGWRREDLYTRGLPD